MTSKSLSYTIVVVAMGLFDFLQKTQTLPPSTQVPKAKILVVDDEQYLREFYQELLIGEGYDVMTATNGQEALDIVSQNPPHAILLDITMPVMDGNEVMKRLWNNPATKKIPVLVLTNAGSIKNMENAEYYSAYRFFIKANVSPEEIISSVKLAISSHKTTN